MPGLPPHNEIGIHVRKIEFFRHVLLLKVVELERRHEPERKAGLLFQLFDDRLPDGIQLLLLELGSNTEHIFMRDPVSRKCEIAACQTVQQNTRRYDSYKLHQNPLDVPVS